MMESDLGEILEDEIQMELEQLKYSRLYQKSQKKPIQKPESVSESPDKSEVRAKSSMALGHNEL